jgi:hypothetical protein
MSIRNETTLKWEQRDGRHWIAEPPNGWYRIHLRSTPMPRDPSHYVSFYEVRFKLKWEQGDGRHWVTEPPDGWYVVPSCNLTEFYEVRFKPVRGTLPLPYKTLHGAKIGAQAHYNAAHGCA